MRAEERVKRIDATIREERESLRSRTTFALFSLVGGLPQIHNLAPTRFQPVACSIFPGPKEAMTLDGSQVSDMYYAIDGSKIYRKHDWAKYLDYYL